MGSDERDHEQAGQVTIEGDINADNAGARVFDAKGFVRLGAGGKKPGGRQVGLVPGAEVTLMALSLPQGVQGAAREQVARRQVADLTGQGAGALDVRPFHVPGEARSWTRVLVADSGAVAAWREQAGSGARAVLPDYLCLPAAEGLWVLAGQGDNVMARLGPGDGFSAGAGLAAALLDTAWQDTSEATRPKAVLLQGALPGGVADVIEGWGVPVVSEAGALAAHGLDAPKVLGHGELGFDLRSDPQAARAKLRARVLPWRWPVLAGLVAAGLWSAGQYLAIERLDEQRRELAAASAALVREHFVPQGPILDIRTQVSRALAERRAGSEAADEAEGPLEIFGRAASVLTAARAKIGQVNYGRQGGLELIVTMPDFAALDQLTGALAQEGLRVSVAQSRNVADGAEARLGLAAGEGQP